MSANDLAEAFYTACILMASIVVVFLTIVGGAYVACWWRNRK